jgi:hypothetical protein
MRRWRSLVSAGLLVLGVRRWMRVLSWGRCSWSIRLLAGCSGGIHSGRPSALIRQAQPFWRKWVSRCRQSNVRLAPRHRSTTKSAYVAMRIETEEAQPLRVEEPGVSGVERMEAPPAKLANAVATACRVLASASTDLSTIAPRLAKLRAHAPTGALRQVQGTSPRPGHIS